MTTLNRIGLLGACVLGLTACDIAPTQIDWEQQQLEKGKTAIAECVAIQCSRLDLDNAILDDYAILNDMPHVTALMASYTGFSDLSTITGMTQLQELHIGQTDVADLSLLSAFPNLTVLHAQFLDEVTDFSPITRLTRLEELVIGDYRFDDLGLIAAMPQLKRLLVNIDADVDLSPLRGHPGLEKIDFGDQFVTDISVLLTLPRLREVRVQDFGPDDPIAADAATLTARGVQVLMQPVMVVC